MSETATTTTDVRVENHGSVILFRLLTPAAEAWVEEYVPDDAQFMGNALVVEPRYANMLADGMFAYGLGLE